MSTGVAAPPVRLGWRPPRVPLVVRAALPGAAVVACAVVAGVLADVPRRDLFRDPGPYLGTPAHVGVVSTLGVIVWAAAAAVALVSSDRAADPVRRRWLRGAGVLTAVVCVDDAFVLHESVLPGLTGVPEEVLLLGYLAAAAALLRGARRLLAGDPATPLLLAAVALLAGSQALDVVGSLANPFAGAGEGVRNVAEEGLKFVGCTVWLGYLRAAGRA